jgi:hypothetical protein
MQAKLHRWAAADPGRRFDDLFNLVHDPATLIVAFARVAGNKGANTPGVDGVTAEYVEQQVGVPGFLDDLRAALKDGSFRLWVPKTYATWTYAQRNRPIAGKRSASAAGPVLARPEVG